HVDAHPELRPQELRGADVIRMGMGENDRGDVGLRATEALEPRRELLPVAGNAGVDDRDAPALLECIPVDEPGAEADDPGRDVDGAGSRCRWSVGSHGGSLTRPLGSTAGPGGIPDCHNQTMSAPAENPPSRARWLRRWGVVVLGAVAVGLFPWTLYLTFTLPARHLTPHWDVAWAGFDITEAIFALATAIALLRNSVRVGVLASITGTFLVCDAWFD